MLPVLYARSGFGGTAPANGQRRFINSPDSYARLLEGCHNAMRALPGAVVGAVVVVAPPHSLRAVTPEELKYTVGLAGDGPLHIHIAEQVKEVEDCIAWSGQRPVEWLYANATPGQNWCLIHATHMTANETRLMAESGAVTESNLGDGIFPGSEFLAAGGRFGVGSDCNVLIGVSDELRQFEYSQRLATRARNVMAPANGSTGRTLFDAALGVQAGLAGGMPADFVSLDLSGAPGLSGNHILDGWIFANNIRPDGVWVNGKNLVDNGRHIARESISANFRRAMRQLMDNTPAL